MFIFSRLIILLLSLGVVTCAFAREIPWQLEADKVVAQKDAGLVEASGSVFLFKGDDYLQADYARFYPDTHWVYLRGNVKIKWQEDYLQAEEAEFDLKNKVGWLKNGQIFLAKENIYFKGEQLEKTGKDTYKFKEATVTSCNGELPPWSFKTSEGELTIDGYAKLWNPRFQVKGKPVLYAPYLIVPVKTKRQSGLLIPQISHSDRLGLNINQPYYQVIDDENDFTIFENYYSQKGFMHGLEFRHTPNLVTKGLWRFDYLKDKKEKTEADEDPQFQGDGLIRPNTDRFWLRGKYNGYLFSPEWKIKIDLDLVSDQNYLREFHSGLSGFKRTRKEMLKQFGRDIEDNDDLTRTNTLSLSRNWTNFGLDARIVYTQNLKYANNNLDPAKNPTLQRLPELNLDIYKTPIARTPLEFEAENQLVYFWREYGTRGTRIDLHPKISLPLKTSYLTLIPKVGWRQTLYFIDKFENDPQDRDTQHRQQSRGIYDIALSASTEMFRLYDLETDAKLEKPGQSEWTMLKHTITPKLDYTYIPEKDQVELPYFDSVDRIGAKDQLTYSLINLVTRRKDTLVADAETNSTIINKDYLDFLRLKLKQSYDFREARRKIDLDNYPRRPFSDLLADLTLKPDRYLSLTSKTYYSFYLSKVTEHEHYLTLYWPEKISVWFGLDFQEKIDEYKRKRENRLKILNLGSQVDFIPNWRARISYSKDLELDQELMRSLTLTYLHQCFTLDLIFTRTDFEDRYELRLNLLNLGSIGG
jgi:LPS-assembly protein